MDEVAEAGRKKKAQGAALTDDNEAYADSDK